MRLLPSLIPIPSPTPNLVLHPHLHLPKNWERLSTVKVSGDRMAKFLTILSVWIR